MVKAIESECRYCAATYVKLMAARAKSQRLLDIILEIEKQPQDMTLADYTPLLVAKLEGEI